MPNSRIGSMQIALQLAELALAAPQVVLHRTSRMALAGAAPSARDRAEFARMGNEKVVAFYESWAAMWTAAFAAQLELAGALSAATLAALTGGQASGASALAVASKAAASVAAAGLAPVHKKATANAKRLARIKR